MRMIRFLSGLLLLTSLAALPVRAQSWYALTYQPAQPLGNTQDFTDNFGWRGIGFDFKKMIKPKLALGISAAWQVFDHQTDQVVSAFGVDISGDQFRYINSWPFLANINYFFGSQGKARPYVAANVGAYVIEQRMDIGLYSIPRNQCPLRARARGRACHSHATTSRRLHERPLQLRVCGRQCR
jgi:hypothetical protein